MAREVDERVVQMRMENGAFERAAQITISTLDKIKSALNFGNASKSLDELDGAVKTTNLDRLAQSVEVVSSRFSALGIMGVTALQNITNKALDAGEQLVKSLTVAPISQGFEEYELKMNSVQTIMASTGAPLEEINGYLEELNTYADRTIYSFSDMTSSIGKFTNAGVDLRSAVKAIQGISNAAAVSGSNAQQASHAMYNFAQALSSGAVKLLDWKSIEYANMATVEFKQQLLDTALALGTVRMEGDRYVTTTTDLNGKVSEAFNSTSMFNESLSHQWMTTDVLVETLGRYADETTEIGKKAFSAAQDVKTFSQLLDTMKEAVGSGWAQTFEYIIGDFNEAKELWTSVNNVADEFIANMSDARNVSLKFWHDNGGRAAALEGLANIFKGLWSAMKPIGEAWREMFPATTGERLVELSEKLRDATKYFRLSDTAADGLKGTVKLLLVPLKLLVEVFKITVKIGAKFVGIIVNGAEKVLEFVGTIYNLISSFTKYVKESELVNKIIDNASKGFGKFAGFVHDAKISADGFVESIKEWKIVQKITKFFDELGGGLNEFAELTVQSLIDKLEEIASITPEEWYAWFSDAKKEVDKFIESVKQVPIVQDIMEGASWAFGRASEMFWDFVDAVKSFGSSALDWIAKKFESLKTIRLSDIGNSLVEIGNKIKEYFEAMKDMSIPEKVFQMLGDGLLFVRQKFVELVALVLYAKDKLKEFWRYFRGDDADAEEGIFKISTLEHRLETTSSAFTSFVSKIDIRERVKAIGNGLSRFAETVWEALKRIDMSKVFLFSFGVAILFLIRSISKAIGAAGGLFKSVGELSDTLSDFLKNIMGKKSKTENMKDLALSIVALVGALILLAMIDKNKLAQGAIAMLGVISALAAITGILSKLKKSKVFEGAKEVTSAMLLLSGGVTLLSISLKILEDIDWKAALRGIGYITLLSAELIAAALIISGKERKVLKGSIFLISFSQSVRIMAKALLDMAGADWDTIWKGLAAFSGIMLALSAVLATASGVRLSSGLGVMIIISSLYLIKGAVEKLSKIEIPSDKVESTILKLVGVVGAIMALMMATGMAGKYAIRGSIAIAILFKTVDLIADAVYRIQDMFNGKIGKINETVLTLITVFGGFAALLGATHFVGKYAIRGAMAVSIMSATFMLIGDFIEKIANFSEQQLYNASNMLITIGVIFAGLLASMKLFSKNVDIKPVVTLGAIISILMISLNKLADMSWKQVLSAGASMGVALAMLAAIINSTSKIQNNKGILTIITTMLALAETSTAIYILANLPWEKVVSAGLSLGVAMLAFAKASSIATNNARGVLTMASVAIIATATVIPLSILANADWKDILASATALSLTMLALSAATKIAEGSISGMAGLISASASALIASIAIKQIADFDWKNIAAAAGSLSITMLALAAAAKIASGIQAFGGGIALTAMAFAMQFLAEAIERLSKLPFWSVVGAISGLAAAIVALGVAATILGVFSEFAILGAAVLAALAGAAWIGSEAMLNYAKAMEIFANTLLKFSHTTQQEARNIGVAIATIFTSFMDTMIQYFGQMVTSFIGAGQNTVNGFVAGIFSKLKDASAAGGTLGKIAFAALCKVLGIHSPSLLASWAGSMMDSGFANGIVDNLGQVFNASELMGSTSLDGLYSGLTDMSGVGDYFSDAYLDSIMSSSDSWYNTGFDMSEVFKSGNIDGMSDNSYLNQLLGGNYLDQIMSSSDSWYNTGFDMSEVFKSGNIDGMSDNSYLNQLFGSDYISQIMSNSGVWENGGFDLGQIFGGGMTSGLGDGSSLNQYLDSNWIPQMSGVDFFGAGEESGKSYARGLHSKKIDSVNASTELVDAALGPLKDKSKMGKAGSDFAEEITLNASKKEFSDRMKTAGEEQVGSYTGALMSGVEKAKTLLGSSMTGGIIGQLLGETFGANEEFMRSRGNSDVKEYVGAFSDKGRHAELKNSTVQLMSSAIEGIESVNFSEVGMKVVDEFVNSISNEEDKIDQVSRDLSSKMITNFDTKLSELSNVGVNSISGFISAISQNKDRAVNTAKNVATTTVNQFQNQEKNYGTSGRTSIFNFANAVSGMASFSASAGYQVGNSTVNAASQAVSRLTSIGTSIGQSFANAIRGNSSNSYNAGANLSQSAINGANSKSGGTYSIGSNLGQGLISGMESKRAQIYSIAASLAQAAAEAMAKAAQVHSPSRVTEEIGENMGKGLGKGMASGASSSATRGAASNAARDLANSVKKGLVTTLAIASPSKEAIEIGEYVGEGFAIGISNTEDLVAIKSVALANTSMSALKEALERAGKIIESEEDSAPVITPVIDLTNVEDGMNAISSMFSNKGVISVDQFTLDNLSATQSSMTKDNINQQPIKWDRSNDTALLKAIEEIGNKFDSMKQSISGMQVILDKKTIVGEIALPMDREFGAIQSRIRRGN